MPPPLLLFTMTQQPSPDDNTWIGSTQSDYTGSAPYETDGTLTPDSSGNDFPDSSPTPTIAVVDSNGSSAYTASVTLNGTPTTKTVPVKIIITNPPAGSFNALLTITVQATYSDG